MLVGLHERRIRPEAILFADVGSEKQGTYAFIPHLQAWLAHVRFPPLTIVRYQPVRAPYSTLEGNMVANATLPGATFNRGSCTLKFKVEPQNRHCRSLDACRKAWARGEKVLKLIGFEACEGYPCLPMTGSKKSREQERTATVEFREARQRHPGVESAIGALQSGNGLDRCRDHSYRGFRRYVGLGILGRNLHVLGKVLLERDDPECLAAYSKRKRMAV